MSSKPTMNANCTEYGLIFCALIQRTKLISQLTLCQVKANIIQLGERKIRLKKNMPCISQSKSYKMPCDSWNSTLFIVRTNIATVFDGDGLFRIMRTVKCGG